MRKLIISFIAILCFCFVYFPVLSQPSYCQQVKQAAHQSIRSSASSFKNSNSRSDTIDILKYIINLEITDFSNFIIKGNAQISFNPKMNNVNELNLDLLKLAVDSIKFDTTLLTSTYDDTLLKINLPYSHSTSDTSIVTIYYHGTPKSDAAWGGFYFTGGYAFNIGVGLTADPHNLGRVWFPCFDNFVERSKYEFNISTNNGKVAYCNGTLTKDTSALSGLRTRTWVMEDEIPSYLASVAVAGYTQINQTYNGINGTVPIVLTALPSDTMALKNSFVNLGLALTTYENSYGPYLWDRVGYCIVPFNGGAMEHATSISYPKFAVDGGLTYQTLMAHELSHHWWGDLATCEEEEDMWINEGMATYSEHLFTEGLQGMDAYKSAVRNNHERVLHYTHIKENGYRAISGIPHAYTYGEHVYLKGADVAHTMRGYLGDSLFFVGLKYILSNHQFASINSNAFMNAMSTATGKNMNSFLNEWVLNPGFPHFSIDSFSVTPNGGSFDVRVFVKQKLTGAPAYFTNVPLELTFIDANWQKQVEPILMSGANASFQITTSINPIYIGLNLEEKINDATAPEMKVISTTGTFNFTNARMAITVSSITDSAFIKVDHNYTTPDPYKIPKGYRLSPNRYWKVDGIFPLNFDATAKIFYDGRAVTSNGAGYLDHNLITATEDSLVLMYRKGAGDDWNIFSYYSKTINIPNDKYGYVIIDSLLPGEYVFAMQDYTVGIEEQKTYHEKDISIFPNPASDLLNIDLKEEPVSATITITDINGKAVYQSITKPRTNLHTINTKNMMNGIYFLSVAYSQGEAPIRQKIIILH